MAVQTLLTPSRYSGANPNTYSTPRVYASPYFNTAQTQAAQQQQQSSGSFGGFSPSSISNLSSVRNFFGGGTNAGGAGTLANLTNQIGGSLGFATTAPVATYATAGALPWQTVGAIANPANTTLPWLAGGVNPAGMVTQGSGILGTGLGGTSTLGSTLGAAGLGAFAGGFLGKIGGNSTGGSIGGAIGAAVGNMIVPGVGGVIGGLIGGIGGGFFGNNKPATNSDEFRGQLKADGTFTQTYQGGKNAGGYAGFGKSVTQNFSDMLALASKKFGFQFSDKIEIGGGISTRHGGSHINVGIPRNSDSDPIIGEQIFYDYTDQASVDDAFYRAFTHAANISGASPEKLKEMMDWFKDPSSRGNIVIPKPSQQNAGAFQKFLDDYKVSINGPSTTDTTSTAATTTDESAAA